MKRVEQAAQAAYALDIGAGHAAASSSSSAAAVTPKTKPPPPKPSDPYANYTTAASLGISDPDVDRLIEEAKVRQSEGRAGDWVVVAPSPPPLPESGGMSITSAVDGVKSEQEVVVGEVRKREEDPPDDDDTRRFKVRRKTAAVGLGEIYDPGIIRVKPRVQRDAEGEPTAIQVTVATSHQPTASGPILGGDILQGSTNTKAQDTLPKATEMPSWTPREWKWAGDNEGEDSSTALQADSAPIDEKPKVEATAEVLDMNVQSGVDSAAHPFPDADEKVKKEEELAGPDPLSMDSSSTGSLFRKRKVPVGSNRGRRKV